MITLIILAVAFIVSLGATLWVLRPPRPGLTIELCLSQHVPRNHRLFVQWVDVTGRPRQGLFLQIEHARQAVAGGTVLRTHGYDWRRSAGIEVPDE